MATIRELITTWGFNIDLASLEKMDAKVGALTKDVNKVGENIDKVSKGMIDFGGRLTAFVTVPIIALGTVMAKSASDAEETESKFEAVFSGISKESSKVAENLRNNFGLGRIEAKKLLGDTGDLLTGFGFTQKSALDLANQVQELAVDLSSFTNNVGGAEAASIALTKALLGERESVKTLGIAILEEDVKKQVALNNTKGLTFESMRQAKAFATLQLAQQQSKNSIGDFNRTQSSTANQLKLLTRDLKDEALVLGNLLLPVLTKVVSMARKAVFWFSQLEEGTKETIIAFLGVVVTVGPLILILGILGVSLISIIKAYKTLKLTLIAARTAQLAFTASSLIIPIVLLAIGLALGILIDDFRRFFEGNKSALGAWLGDWVDVLDSFFALWDSVVLFVVDAMDQIMIAINRPFEAIDKLITKTKSLPGFLGIAGEALNLGLGIAEAGAGGGILGAGGGARLTSAGSGAINRSSNSTVVANINMSIPEGTPEQQVAMVEEAGKRVVQDEIDLILRRLNNEFPEIE